MNASYSQNNTSHNSQYQQQQKFIRREYPEYLNECKVDVINNLIEQISYNENDWEKLAFRFPDYFKLDEILAIEREASRLKVEPAREVINRLRSAMIPLGKLQEELKHCSLVSASDVLEREMHPNIRNTRLMQQNLVKNESEISLVEKGFNELQDHTNNSINHNSNKYENLIQSIETYLPAVLENSLTKSMRLVGNFNMVSIAELRLICLKSTFEHAEEYLRELKMMKLRHLNLLTGDMIVKDSMSNKYSLLYCIDDNLCHMSLDEYVPYKHAICIDAEYKAQNDTLDKIQILIDIASALLYLHAKTAIKNPIFHANFNKHSILVSYSARTRIQCKIGNFRSSLEIDNQNNEHILMDDVYNLGLIIYSVLTWKDMTKEECFSMHAQISNLSEKDQRLARIELKNRSLPKLNVQTHKDILTKLFLHYFLVFTLDTTGKRSVQTLLSDLIKYEGELTPPGHIQTLQQTHNVNSCLPTW